MGKYNMTAEDAFDSAEADPEIESPPSSPERDPGAADGAGVSGKTAEDGVNSVDKIREILFGNHKREFSRRMAELEEGFRKELEEIRHEQNQRHEALETYIHREIDALIDQVENEQRQRTEQLRELSEAVEKTRKAHEKRIEKIEEEARKTSKEFRQQLLDQTKGLSGEIQRKSEEAASRFAAAQQEMRGDMVDRSSLGALFTRMGMQLASEAGGAGDER